MWERRTRRRACPPSPPWASRRWSRTHSKPDEASVGGKVSTLFGRLLRGNVQRRFRPNGKQWHDVRRSVRPHGSEPEPTPACEPLLEILPSEGSRIARLAGRRGSFPLTRHRFACGSLVRHTDLSNFFIRLRSSELHCHLPVDSWVRISTPSSDTNSGTITFLTGLPFSAAVDEEDLLSHGFLLCWADVQLLDDRSQSLAHDAASRPARPPVAGGMFWLSRKRFVES